MRATRALAGTMLVSGALLAGVTAAPTTSVAGPSNTPGAVSAVKAEAGKAKSSKKKKAKSAKKKAKSSTPIQKGCKRTRRFNENRFGYTKDAKLGGRCAASRYKKVKLISSYNGHHPAANKALDIMVNLSGSCSAGNKTGDQVARYMMNNAGKHGVRYIIWQNSYWAYGSGKKKFSDWRKGMHSGSCTTRHYDHVHVAFR